MDQKTMMKEIKPLDIVFFHVGGTGGYGHIDTVIKRFAPHAVVVCFEANSSDDDALVQQQYNASGVRTFFVPKCVGDRAGKQPFYVNQYNESNSLFLPSPQALEEHIMCVSMSKGCPVHTWGQNCELDHMEEVETVTLDGMIADRLLPAPDVLSIDAQGAELRIMRGGEQSISEEVICIVTEVEFHEIYKGQDLFNGQMDFMLKHGFRFTDLFSKQYWHPGPSAGKGFLTVGEALFLREMNKYYAKFKDSDKDKLLYKLIKLAAVSYAFGRFSYASKIVSFLIEEYGKKAKSLFLSSESYEPVLKMQEYMEKNHAKYLKDFNVFYKGPRNSLKRFVRAGRAFLKSVSQVHDNID